MRQLVLKIDKGAGFYNQRHIPWRVRAVARASSRVARGGRAVGGRGRTVAVVRD